MTETVALGLSVPPYTPHAISVSLPTWRDNIGYEEGEKRVIDAMVSGYPRFFIPLSVQKLASIYEQKYTNKKEKCLLFPSRQIAEECRLFIERRSETLGPKKYSARCVEERRKLLNRDDNGKEIKCLTLYIVFFPEDAFKIAKEFWQHTGMGVSSRFAERFLALSVNVTSASSVPKKKLALSPKVSNRYYAAAVGQVKTVGRQSLDQERETGGGEEQEEEQGLGPDHAAYLEERYGRNLHISVAASAKRALRRRLAGVMIREGVCCTDGDNAACSDKGATTVVTSSRGVMDVKEGDVYLLSTGMSAIWTAHQVLLGVGPAAKSVCFGFPYTDTLKILQKWGPGCYFLGHGLDSDIDELEALLERETTQNPDQRPIMALFTEFPSNPLLRSADLPRLRALAAKYDFAIVVDETIGSIMNVEVLQYADVVVSSLTKIFSGEANVMGGSLILNPHGRYYQALKQYLDATFEDTYFDEDAIFLERNSRDFKRRIRRINGNTEAVCDFLRSRSTSGGCSLPNTVIKEVFYPKYITPQHYEHCRIKGEKGIAIPTAVKEGKGAEEGGYGGLFSLTFVSRVASEAFFDALPCYKGPSLGTNFTLACPYTILAHYAELDWAQGYGVEPGLVRVSVGMEDRDLLLNWFETALSAAEEEHAKAGCAP
ncbi:hypothetical protein AMATHDRAFT_76597 [Amanita thiersii Skay4041]|uniref:Cystathionine gamma-synthase n=1 Tax=Amanita thiersii Skay4041 TaxID=703135 RepID=A0A2A9NK33_9AGAR|nr:hypothetical protein AMATHDRAFT_76597 [Amanita thiersii Skay4041]